MTCVRISKFAQMTLAVVAIAGVLWSAGCSAATPAPTVAPTATGQVHVAPATATPGPALGSQQVNGLLVVLRSHPASPIRGRNVLDVLIADAESRPVTDARVSFDMDMTTMSHGINIVPAQSNGNGHYTGQAFFMMPGPWRVITVIERPGRPADRVRFNFNVKLK